MKRLISMLIAAPLSLTMLAGTASAEFKIEEGGFKSEFSGQINRGFLFVDDGVESDSFSVDNDNSSTRLRWKASYDLGKIILGGEIEYEFEFSSTAAINQINTDVSESVSNERKFEAYIQGSFGKLSYGQGDTASNGTSEVDLSGTSVVGYSGVADFAGGFLFRDGDGELTNQRVGGNFSNLDGNSRVERIRYDTPVYKGFTLSLSYGEDDEEDFALRYKKAFGDFTVQSAISYNSTNFRDRINGSISALHEPTGINLTYASGRDDLSDTARDPSFNYIKLGYKTDKLLKYGTTAFAIDYYNGDDIGSLGSDSDSFGVLAVQNFDDLNTEVYAGYRNYSASVPGTSLQDLDGFLIGTRVKF